MAATRDERLQRLMDKNERRMIENAYDIGAYESIVKMIRWAVKSDASDAYKLDRIGEHLETLDHVLAKNTHRAKPLPMEESV